MVRLKDETAEQAEVAEKRRVRLVELAGTEEAIAGVTKTGKDVTL